MRILVPIDETEYIAHIGEFITARQWPPHTHFLVLHCVEELRPPVTSLPDQVQEQIKREVLAQAQALVHEMATRIRDHFKDAAIDEEVVCGQSRARIVERAEQWSADMIVMGAHNRKLLDRFFLGSVSSAVMGMAHCSVVIIRPAVEK